MNVKDIIKRIFNYQLLLVLILVLGMTSCSQNSDDETTANMTQLKITITGAEEIEEDNSGESKASTAKNQSNANAKPDIESHGDFDAIVQLKNDSYRIPSKNVVRNVQSSSGSGAKKAVAMEGGKQFRMLIYKPDGTLYANQLATAATPLTIDVVKGDTYKWIAYSYNEDATVPLPDITDPANPSIPTGEGYDVLYASDNITISNSGNTPLGIVFKHAMNRIGVELNTMGMFADLVSATIAFPSNYFTKGRLNLSTGAVTDEGSYSTSSTSDFVQVPGYAYADRNVVYYYTANAAAISTFQVNLTALTIKLDDTNNRSFTTTTTFTVPSGIPASTMGKSRTVSIDLIESPLTIDADRWARANIYYIAGDHNPYRFHHTYEHKQQRNSYFAFKAHLPESFSVVSANIDPCGEVYPKGTWKHAGYSEYFNLMSKTRSYGTVSGNGYTEYAATGVASPYPSNRLRFNFNGQGVAGSLLNLLVIDFGSSFGNSANLWTDDEGANALIQLGAWGFLGNSIVNSVNLELLNIGLLGAVNVVQTPFKNIRCVRN